MLQHLRFVRCYSKLKGLPLRPIPKPTVIPQATPIEQAPPEQVQLKQEPGLKNHGQQSINPSPESSSRARKFQRSLLQWVWYGGAAMIVLHLFTSYGYHVVFPYGVSMLPTLHVTGETLILSRLYVRGKNVKVGDIVTFRHPVLDDVVGMKRVIGMPGDYVLSQTPAVSDQMIQVPDGHCFVVGDNSLFSRDSRHFGPIPLALITGKVVARLLPFDRRRWFTDPYVPA